MVYIGTPCYIDYGDYLSHHGILGMRWGIRRYQNKDGSLTEAGKRRVAKLQARQQKYEAKSERYANEREYLTTPHPRGKYAKISGTKKETSETKKTTSESNTSTETPKKPTGKKSVFDMSDDELKSEVARLDLIKKYNSYMKEIYKPKKEESPVQRERLVDGRKIVGTIITNSLTDVGSQYMKKRLQSMLRLEKKDKKNK